MLKLQLNTSLKTHTIVAFVISLWLVLFLVLIAPFDAGDLSFMIRVKILPFYGVLSFAVYMVLIPIQNRVFFHYKTWNIVYELLFLFAFNVLVMFCSYAYYKTDIINGEYGFTTFAFEVYLPICLILMTILVFLRWFINKKQSDTTQKTIILKGNNKLDVLKILPEDLICISSADNYVEVNYLIKGELHKKLLRNTLKGIQNDVPDLLKVHRSHLINPSHFKEWKDSGNIKLTEIDVPVSKNYKASVLELI